MYNILFEVYDATGGVIIGDTETIVIFDSERIMSPYSSLSSGEISIQLPTSRVIPPEYYILLLFAKISGYVSSGNNRSQAKAWIEIDSGSGYVPVSGTDGYIYTRTDGAGWGTTQLMTTFRTKKINTGLIKFRIRAQRVVGSNTIVTQANASNFVCCVINI